MDIHEKLNLLGQAARFDDCVSAGASPAAGPLDFGLFARPESCGGPGPDMFPYVSHHQRPDGCRVAVLKVLQTSACQNNCNYCAFRSGRDTRRGHFTPDELARAFDLMQRAGVVQGIFLSSGVLGTNRTMDEMLATVELIRRKYAFRGYVHLKLLPGAEAAHVEAAVALADRVSANLEGPTVRALAALAPQKRLPELVGPLRAAAQVLRSSAGKPPPAVGGARIGLSTQFVVGPAGESDRELLASAENLYREARLARTYYSAFTPVRDTPLEGAPPTDPRREHRLYQADWLLRFYGFSVDELPFDADGLLNQGLDPKDAWAQAHPERFPVELNRAPLAELLRIPGIGPASARAIVAARRQAKLTEMGELRRLGARADRAAPYVLLDGQRPPHQPRLPMVGV